MNEEINVDELIHFGVPGMHWGKHKSKSANDLTDYKKAKINKKYVKIMNKVSANEFKKDTELQIQAHNKAAEYWNNGQLEKFNKANKPSSPNYESKMEEAFGKDVYKNLTKSRIEFIEQDVNYKKAQKLVSEYDMLKFSEVVKQNEKDLSQLKKVVGMSK